MDSSNANEAIFEFFPFLRIHQDGQVERLLGTDVVPSSVDTQTNVSSKDIVIDPETGLSARIYLPEITNPSQKLPLLIYFHGGGFCIESAFSPTYHNYLNLMVSKANIVVMSVNYRLAPEFPLPIGFNDSWAAIHWVARHSSTESWLRDYVDFDRVFLGGDSAGGNIAHNMAIRAGDNEHEQKLPDSMNILGVVLFHPYFWGEKRIGSEDVASPQITTKLMTDMWIFATSKNTGIDDPHINPFVATAPSLSQLGCRRVLVFIAEKDVLRDRGQLYYEILKKSGWRGNVEIMEIEGEDHVFHIFNPTSNAFFASSRE
ncbi:hypothetical protein GIB67_011269 [Kingdonia uniflora]|uniref:Alpha/beta hydrolase fold-3 domain-containing protein n=1 Tax=Kingdonia uniflora TaxID=39325 RepID=A0A7J7N9U7_9MAGN|nr:hypothetical protein GIB67_011269 [Kingdonia uniflora]